MAKHLLLVYVVNEQRGLFLWLGYSISFPLDCPCNYYLDGVLWGDKREDYSNLPSKP
jgi:hypothetical protein